MGAMVQTMNTIESSPLTGRPIALVAMTGDSIDNTQRNELDNFLALFDGGTVQPDSGAPGYEGAQAAGWPGEICWKPDGPAGGDVFQPGLGFPPVPGLIERAMRPLEAAGLRHRWLRGRGNHQKASQCVRRLT